MATFGNSIFAGTPAGVYRSDDEGATWSDVSFGLASLDVEAITAIGNTLYAGTNSSTSGSGAVYLSTDKGSNWTAISENTLELFQYCYSLGVIGSKLFSEDDGSVWRWSGSGMNWTKLTPSAGLFATIGNDLFIANEGGPLLSTDAGDSWMPANDGLPNQGFLSIFANGNDLYIGVASSGGTGAAVYLSTDNGSHWSQANSGLPIVFNGKTYDNEVWAFDAIADTIYAGSEDGIYSSTNKGTAWMADTSELHDGVFAFTHDSSYIFAGTLQTGVWRSHR